MFEKSKKDVEPRGMREGSVREEAMDARQAGSKRKQSHPQRAINHKTPDKVRPQRG